MYIFYYNSRILIKIINDSHFRKSLSFDYKSYKLANTFLVNVKILDFVELIKIVDVSFYLYNFCVTIYLELNALTHCNDLFL